MVALDEAAGELLFRVHGVAGGHGLAEEQEVVAGHEFVGDAHQLSKNFHRRLVHPDVVAEALRHFLHAVEPLEQRHEKDDLLRLPLFALEVATHEDVEKLIGAADFHVGADDHGIPALHDRVLDFVEMDGLAAVDAAFEILALEHLLEGHAGVEFHDLLKGHHLEPFAIEDGARAAGIEDFESLRLEAFGVAHDLVVRKLRARFRAAGGVADHRGEVADDEDGLVAEILKLPELLQRDGEAEVNVRRGGIDAELDIERAAEPEFGEQVLFADDFRGAAFQDFELLFG